jgi:Ni,Fe-hydrogenase maturation factor
MVLKRKILVFGNPVIGKDSVPVKIIPELQKEFPAIEFKHLDGIDDIQKEGVDLVIIDSVEGLKKSKIITDIDSIISGNKYSMHDFDLGQNLRLLKKIKAIENVIIIGIPMKIGETEAKEQAARLIRSIA